MAIPLVNGMAKSAGAEKKKMRWLEAGVALLLGMLASLVLLEAGLRVFGWVQEDRGGAAVPVSAAKEPREYRILCAGDSYTYGIGAPGEMSYPAQLERLLAARFPGRTVRVYNGGLPGRNSTQILEKLKEDIDRVSPDLVVWLAGGANGWNLYKAYERANERSLLRRMCRRLYVFKTYKLIALLGRDVRAATGPEWSATFFCDPEPPALPDGAAPSARAGWKLVLGGRYTEAAAYLRKAAREVTGTGEYLWRAGYALERSGDLAGALACYQESVALPRDSVWGQYLLGMMYCRREEYEKAAGHFMKGLSLHPAQESNPNIRGLMLAAFFCDEAEHGRFVAFLDAVAKQEQRFARSPVYRDMRAYMADASRRGSHAWVREWVEQDVAEMLDLCRGKGVRVILQNYPVGPEPNRFLSGMAARFPVPFVDQSRLFDKHLAGGKWEDYFAPDNHCNARGYGLMAENVADAIAAEGFIEGGER